MTVETILSDKMIPLRIKANIGSVALLAVAMYAFSSQGAAADSVIAFAGAGTDFSTSGFIGGTFALPGSVASKGWAVRAVGFTGGYDYPNDRTTIHGNFTGGELDGVYQFSGNGSWLDLVAGARYTDTHLSPRDTSNRRLGDKTEFEFGADGGHVSGPWRLDWYGSFGTLLDDYALRASLTHVVVGKFRAGLEFSAEGDPTYNLQRLGPYIGLGVHNQTELQFSVGADHESGEGEGAFARVGINATF